MTAACSAARSWASAAAWVAATAGLAVTGLWHLLARRLDDPGAQLGQVRLVLGAQRRERGGEAGIRGHGLVVYPDQVLLGGDGVQQHLGLL